MYIMNGNDKEIINAHYVERFCIVEKPDAVLVVASYGDARPPVTLARYADVNEAKDALQCLMYALYDKPYFYFPDSRLFAEQKTVHDARTKRKGGS